MRRPTGDRGTVLPLVIGLAVVVLGLVATVTDVSVLWLDRRAAQAAADGAALAAAHAVDLDRVYTGSSRGDLPLDPAGARSAVASYVRAAGLARRLSGFAVTGVTVAGSTVTVSVRVRSRPPFTSWLGAGPVPVTASASALTRTG